MIHFFKKPHPFIFNGYSVAIPAAITFFIILLFAPFSFKVLSFNTRVLAALIIALIVALSIYTTIKMLQKLYSKHALEDRWTVGKEILLTFSIFSIITILITIAVLMVKTDTSTVTDTILKTSFISLAVSSIPILILVLFEQYKHQKIQLKKAHEFTEFLKKKTTKPSIEISKNSILNEAILITSESKDVELRVMPEDIRFVKSDGNYIEVYYKNAGKLQKKLIRNRLKEVENLLPRTTFLRCHNRFIVNGNAILSVEGNARNLMLQLKDVQMSIAVSRSKVDLVSEFLQNLK